MEDVTPVMFNCHNDRWAAHFTFLAILFSRAFFLVVSGNHWTLKCRELTPLVEESFEFTELATTY